VGNADLNGRYQRLRSELDAAYAGPVWNSHAIDRIAEEIAEVERALASAQHAGARAPRARIDGAASRGAEA
jgi:hypothetical protein